MNPQTQMTRGLAWLTAALLLTLLLVWQIVKPGAIEPLPVLYTLGGDFELESTLGRRFKLSDLEGSLVLLNFGYTGCPDVCPTALARIRDVIELLPGERGNLTPVFVTLDPAVDTVDRIAPYVEFFHPAFIGLTGSASEVELAASHYKVFYEKEFMASELGYSISHSSHIYLLDRRGRVRATFGEGVTVQKMAATVQTLSAQWNLFAWQARK